MLTPKQLQSLPKPLTDIYSELSDFVLQDISMRIAKAAKITDTAEYQMYRARALGMSTDAIKKEIARINGAAESEIAELIREAAERSDEFDRKMLGVSGGMTLSENTQLQKLMAAQIEQTRGLCTNLTGTLGFAQKTADGQMVYGSATDFLRKQMDMAQMKVMTGVCDYNTAVRQACFALADSGLRTVYYASGRSDRIEVAVRRALMTSVSQLTQKISEQNAAEFGADGWEISAHIGARPSHAVYQGRQYPNSQYETIVLPLITDYNCRHSAYPIIMGVTKPAYTSIRDKCGAADLVIIMPYTVADILDSTDKLQRQINVGTFRQGNVDLEVKTFNGNPLIRVPSDRMYSEYIFNDGKAGFGFTKTETAKLINWIICPRKVPIAVSKTDGVKIFDPATTQGADAWTIEYRKFHDIWVKDNQLPSMRVSVAE